MKSTPAAPVARGVDFCQGSSPGTLTATLVDNAIPNWYGTAATGGTASTTTPTPANTTVGTTIYYVSQTLNGCESYTLGPPGSGESSARFSRR